VANAIRGALIDAKLSVVPLKLGWWGAKFGPAHTVPCKLTGKCGSVTFRLVPAPRGTGIVAAGAPKRLLQAAGVVDVYSESKGKTKTLGNFIKAAYSALSKTYSFLSPDAWGVTKFRPTPFQEFTDHLKDSKGAKGYKKSFHE